MSLEFAAWKLKSNHVESTNATAIKTNGGMLANMTYQSISDNGNMKVSKAKTGT